MELTIQRRHSPKCPDINKGPNYLKCRGHCKLRVVGHDDLGNRIRRSLGTRDLARAARMLAQFESSSRTIQCAPTKLIDAIETFHLHKADKAPDTKRKYKRVLNILLSYCESRNLKFLPDVRLEVLDDYVIKRRSFTSTWLKEIEILKQFFSFCEKTKLG